MQGNLQLAHTHVDDARKQHLHVLVLAKLNGKKAFMQKTTWNWVKVFVVCVVVTIQGDGFMTSSSLSFQFLKILYHSNKHSIAISYHTKDIFLL